MTVITPMGIVSSSNEWGPLQEVIVGIVDGARVPSWHISLKATMPQEHWNFFRECGGKPFPLETIEAARCEIEKFASLLNQYGVTVRRPTEVDFTRPFSTPDWESPSGLYAAMPRDILLVVGDEIIEAPMSWRSRYHEINAYRPLLREYFQGGARWTSAPRPQLSDASYRQDYISSSGNESFKSVLTEAEPLFDAADLIRCGKDLFCQISHTTNQIGVDWLKRHLGPSYCIHMVEVEDHHAMHIDATLMPLAPGKLLVNPERLKVIPEWFKSWEIITAPKSVLSQENLTMCSPWINMNVFSLDEQRVFVEANEEPTIRILEKHGFDPIPCAFQNFNSLGGSFHCATLDVRRGV